MSKLSSFLHIAEFVVTPILVAVGVPAPLIPAVLKGIKVAEAATDDTGTPKTGAEKKAIALAAAQTAIEGVNAVKPGTLDPAVVTLVDKGIDVAVGTINAIHKDPVASTVIWGT